MRKFLTVPSRLTCPLLNTDGSGAEPWIVRPERRNVLGARTLKLIKLDVLLPFLGTLSTKIVAPIPLPTSEMPFVMSSSALQLQVPAGIITVAPSTAAVTATATSARPQVRAAT